MHPYRACREGILDLPMHGRRPVIIVGGEYTSRTKSACNFCKGALGLHPMEGLGTGDDVRRPIGHSCLVGETVLKAHVPCLVALFGSPSHLRIGFNADHTLC